MATPALESVLEACARGTIAPNITAMQLVLAGADAAALPAQRVLERLRSHERAAGRERIEIVRALLCRSRAGLERVRSVAATVPHRAGVAERDWAAHFDAAVRISPEASVALYSLGDPQLLDAATREIVALLDAWGLLERTRTVLDVGCGIGRICAALAPQVRRVIGLDISAAMLDVARTRCAGERDVRLVQGSATQMPGLRRHSVDLVLAVDCLPYLQLAQGSAPARFMARSAHVLRPGGDLVVFNWSYEVAPQASAAQFAHLARSAGLEVLRQGSQPLRTWDGRVFHARARDVSAEVDAGAEPI